MKDLDFDELDRAVNSLLTNNDAPATDNTTPLPVSDNTVPADEAAPQSQPQPPVQPLAARRSSGRFMDVVHPSSDMRASMPVRPVSREGLGIVPSVSSTPSVEQTTPWAPPVVPEAPTESPRPAAGEWPDPLDFNGFKSDDDQKPSIELLPPEQSSDDQPQSPVDEDKDINQIADAINKTLSQDFDPQAPLESPFLTDAKVEKRPLGAFSTETPPLTATVTPDEASTVPEMLEVTIPTEADVAAPEKEEDHPAQLDTPLPAELQDDLLQIEADVDTTGQVQKEEPDPVLPVSQPETPIGPTSITQQYAEQPSTGDQPTGAIFDTEAYRKPLSHPAKKKSGWMFVLWIVLLLIVGAGAGAAVYFFVLPKL